MTTPHRATPEQWASIEAGIRTYPGQWPGQWGDCVLELRARVEALEATQHWHIGRQGQPTPAEPPPLGLMPRWLADERRLADLDAALQRYKDANLQPPHQWLSERQDLLIALRCRQEAKPAERENAMDELRAASAEARPGERLWQRMEEAGRRELADNPMAEQAELFQAMIREVAAWLRENDSRREMGGDAAVTADLLEQEASR